MCGFSFSISKKEVSLQQIKKMNLKISHRGPDKENFITYKKLKNLRNHSLKFCAGFRRLKIIDLSNKANQPMFYNNRYLIVFNGEIYNYLELKEKLLQNNYKFKSKSDTEVILAAYDLWGKSCFNLFNGMWSMIIYDLKKNKLVASRDRYGVKPFYYIKSQNIVYFASEIKQLLILNRENKVNPKSLSSYLVHDNSYFGDQTFIKNIFQIKPGNYLEIEKNNFNLKQKKWYKFKKKKIGKNQIKKKIKNILSDSVKLRLRSDVNIGISLSGGIDSSVLASLVANLDKKYIKKIYTFSTRTFDHNDEYEYVKEFSKRYKFKNIPIKLEFKNFKKDFIKLVKSHDNPIPNLSVFSEWEVFKKLKKNNIKVNLDGHGADEQLCGYENYYSLYLIELMKSFQILKIINFFIDILFSNFKNKFHFLKKLFINFLPDNVLKKIKNNFNHELNKKWINLNFYSKENIKFNDNLVLNENYKQFFETSLPKQLNWSDINSMSHSVETRSPFLDYNFVENIIPSKMENKIKGITSKYILREAFKEIIPTKIYKRNFKVGFQAPGEKWLNENKLYIKNLFNLYFNYVKEIIDDDCKKKSLEIIDGKIKYKDWIWKLIFLGAWIKHHNLTIK